MDLSEVTQLAKKLLIKTAQNWLFINSPTEFLESFVSIPAEIKTVISTEETYNGVLLFVENSAALKQHLPAVASVLKPETIFWIAYPKKSSGIVSDLEMTGNWQETENYGLQIVASAAVDKTWTALRLRPKNLIKKSTISNAAIENNEFSEFIDTKNRIVILPEDVKQVLETKIAAFDKFRQLAYSHQKEYLVWILTAKQEKTRTSRVLKMIEKLLEK
jgi:uncharacterized protein YdeI (YjbR/CyaY-like superfamily)